MTYCSTATFDSREQSAGVEKEVARILMQSRRNNPKLEIGGVLHYGNPAPIFLPDSRRQRFRKHVNERYEKIATDSRHRDVELLSVKPVSERLFPDWSMKYVAVEARIRRELLEANGLQRFEPYSFDEAFCARLIRCFVEQPDATREKGAQPGNRDHSSNGKRSVWKRIFG